MSVASTPWLGMEKVNKCTFLKSLKYLKDFDNFLVNKSNLLKVLVVDLLHVSCQPHLAYLRI
jgi:hypothetical protein